MSTMKSPSERTEIHFERLKTKDPVENLDFVIPGRAAVDKISARIAQHIQPLIEHPKGASMFSVGVGTNDVNGDYGQFSIFRENETLGMGKFRYTE